MPKRVLPLTVKDIERQKPPVKSDRLLADGGGLYLRITRTGGRSWVYRYMTDGERHDLGLGPYPDITLAEARERATAQRRLRLSGHDPISLRRSERDGRRLAKAKAMSFKDCAERYIDAHKAGWKNVKHAAQWGATLESYVYPLMGKLPVASIDTGLVMQALEPIWSEKPETASRVRGRVESILDWATARGHRQGDNPARWRGHLDNLLPARSKVRRVEHHAALPYAEMGTFMTELRRQKGLAARALEFAILTVGRTGEVRGMTWAEIDLEARTWTIPAERMKAGREHKVPLSKAAAAILTALPRRGDTDQPFKLSNNAMLKLLERMGRDDVTTHGFRSTFSDWCAERTNYPSEVREMALAHVVGDKVEAAYRRGDLFEKRRQLAEAWAKFCAAPPSGEVLSLRRSVASVA